MRLTSQDPETEGPEPKEDAGEQLGGGGGERRRGASEQAAAVFELGSLYVAKSKQKRELNAKLKANYNK